MSLYYQYNKVTISKEDKPDALAKAPEAKVDRKAMLRDPKIHPEGSGQ